MSVIGEVWEATFTVTGSFFSSFLGASVLLEHAVKINNKAAKLAINEIIFFIIYSPIKYIFI